MKRFLAVALVLFGAASVQAQPFSTRAIYEFNASITDAGRFGAPRYTTALLPTCNSDNKGAMAFDSTVSLEKFCDGTSWTSMGGLTGSGTANTVAKWTGASALGNSSITDDGTRIVLANLGTTANPAIVPTGGLTTGIWFTTSAISLSTGGVSQLTTAANVFRIPVGSQYMFTAGADSSTSSQDTGIKRVAAANIAPTNGAAGSGWLQNAAGRSTLAANYTNATTTFSNTALSITVTNARKYTFRMALFVSNSIAADGAKFDFNGGTATATDFRAHCTLFDTALLLSSQVTALATAFSQATVTGNAMMECYGTLEPSATGTLVVRAAMNAATTGTLTVFRGSHIWVEDMP